MCSEEFPEIAIVDKAEVSSQGSGVMATLTGRAVGTRRETR